MPKRAVVKVSGAQKFSDPYVKMSGAWKAVKTGLVKVSGAWKEFYSAISDALANATYDSVSLSYTNTFESASFTMADGGSKLYLVYTDDFNTVDEALYIAEYTLSTPWILSSASLTRTQEIVLSTTGITRVDDIKIKPDGTRIFLRKSLKTYFIDLSTAWNVSTYSFTFSNPDDSDGSTSSTEDAIWIKPDGTKLYAVGSASTIFQHTIDTAWNTNAITSDSKSGDLSNEIFDVKSFYMTSDGEKLFAIGVGSSDTVYQYSLGTAWDISTLSYDGVSYDSTEATICNGVFFRDNRLKMYLLDTSDYEIFQYTLPAP